MTLKMYTSILINTIYIHYPKGSFNLRDSLLWRVPHLGYIYISESIREICANTQPYLRLILRHFLQTFYIWVFKGDIFFHFRVNCRQ